MGETIAVLFVFFILVVLGFMFYARVIKGNLETEKEELSQEKSIEVAQRAMFLPEIQCSENNIIIDNCIDVLKLDSAKITMHDNSLYYFDLLEYSDINITEIYPAPKKWDIYTKTTGDFKNKYITNIPISLYNSSSRHFSFGILTVETRLN